MSDLLPPIWNEQLLEDTRTAILSDVVIRPDDRTMCGWRKGSCHPARVQAPAPQKCTQIGTLFYLATTSSTMKHRFIIPALLMILILVCGCTGTTVDPVVPTPVVSTPVAPTTAPGETTTPTAQVQNYAFTQTITYSDENGTTVITKNKLTKTAVLDLTMYFPPPESESVNKTWYYEFGTALTGGLMQMIFFNETALAEFEEQVAEWNAQEWTVEDDSPPEQRETEPGENPLDGYTVQRLTIRMLEQGTEASISDIVITGPNEEDIAITHH